MKRLLFVGLAYHEYTSAIASEFERLGFAITYHEIQPRSFSYKAARRVLPGLYDEMIRRHHRQIIDAEKGNTYDYVVFVQAHQFSVADIEELRRQHASAKFVLYNWDSLTTHDYRPQMHVFDGVYTFDRDDAAALGINYLPLFCLRSFQALRGASAAGRDVYMVGNIVNPQRYRAVDAFRTYCRANDFPFHAHLACTPYTYYRMLRAGILPRGVSFSYIAHDKFIEMIRRSSAVFDFANHRQSGYTMRVMENLCMGKKLITNNYNILKEPFYSSERIHVYRDLDFSGVKAFLDTTPADQGNWEEAYFIQNFAKTLVS